METAIKPIIIEKVFDAPVHMIWDAITDLNEMKKWYFDVSDFKAEPGFRFQFVGKGHDGVEYIHHCEVKEVIPKKKLSYSWCYEGFDGFSIVSFELDPVGDNTLLKLTHEGPETFPQDNPDFANESFKGGWYHIVSESLRKFLES